ncbi:triacylglycerol lipase, partial [Bifidobacteriaceae bacterium NR015]
FDLSACEGIDNPNTIVVAFRGTDNTLVGWKEDFNMAFRCPIPAQESAAEYLISVTQRYSKYIAKKASLLQKISSFFAKSTNLKCDNRDNSNKRDNNNHDNNNNRNSSPNIIVTGHSKGGNMASYATMRLDAENEKLGNLVSKIYSMDGPGFANDVVDTSVFSRVAS